MKADKIALYLNIALFILGLSLSLSTAWKPYLWQGLGDPMDYIRQTEMSIFSAEFYCPARTELDGGGVHSPRPFTVPLLYKMVGANPDAIIITQKVLNHLSAFLVIAALLLFFKKLSAQILIVLSIHFLLNWWHVSGWTILLISESAATSFFLLWVASFLYYLYKPDWKSGALHIAALILFSFTRDNWPYLLLPFYGLFSFFSLWRERSFLKISLLGLGLMLSIFFLQQAAADYGHRYRLPIMHNLLVRVMPNGVWWKWFEKEGMPQQEELFKLYWGIQPDDKRMFGLYNDKNFQPFFDWVDTKGKSAYMKFLITHPRYSLLLMEKKENLKKIAAHDLWYVGPSRDYTKVFDFIFPLFQWFWIFALLPFLIFAYFRTGTWFFAYLLMLLLVFIVHTLVLYNADTFEVERHMFINQTIWHLLCFMAFSAGIEHWDKLLPKKN